MITEFGGIAYSENKDTTWGYTRTETAEGLANQYCELLATVRSIPMLVFFKNGEARETVVGVQSKEALAKKLDALG